MEVNMQSVKRMPYSDLLFDRNFEQDFDLQNTLESLPNNFKECGKDFFNVFHQGKLEYTDTPNPVEKFFLDSIKETEEFKSMLDNGVNNESSSHFYTRELVEKFGDWKQENPNIENEIEKENSPTVIKAKALARKACKEAEENSELAGQFYDMSSPIRQKDDIQSKLTLARKLKKNPFLKQMIKLAGRLQGCANSKLKQRTDLGNEELIGMELGNDFSRVIPSELARFTDDDLSLFFVKDFVQSNLMQFKYRGKESKITGPIVVAIDESSSMYGDCNLFAKAFLFAINIIAKKTNRELHVIRFSSCMESKLVESEKDLINLMDSFLGGGTNFENPLQETCRIIESDERFKKADLIFITDGEGRLSSECRERIMKIKEKLQFKILGLMIGYSDKVLKTFCDKCFTVFNIYGNAMENFLDNGLNI
jgi:uncharacterized protein with von Willebrand factor type A (vWA) domain